MNRRATRSPVLGLAALLGLSSLVGCSTFERDWQALGQATGRAAGIEGRWDGTWLSDANGHTGALRCILSSDESGAHAARYHAKYGRLFSFEYTVPMTVRREGETYYFSAEVDLGWLAGGRYEYEGKIVGDEFTSSYASSRDYGTFRMRRVD